MSISNLDYFLDNYNSLSDPESLSSRAGKSVQEAFLAAMTSFNPHGGPHDPQLMFQGDNELIEGLNPWAQPTNIDRDTYEAEVFKSNLFRATQATSRETLLGNINEHNNYSAKATPFDQDKLVESPLEGMSEFYNSIASFYTKQAPEFALDIGGQIPSHSLFIGGNYLDVNEGGELINIDHKMFGPPEDMVDMSFEAGESLHFLSSLEDTFFPMTAWKILEVDDLIPLNRLNPDEVRTEVEKLLKMSLPREHTIVTDELFDEILWGTEYGNDTLLKQVYKDPGILDKLGGAFDKLIRGFTEDIPNALGEFFTRAPGAIGEGLQRATMEGLPAMASALTNMSTALEEGVEETTGSKVTLADKATGINRMAYLIAKVSQDFGDWWDQSAIGKIVNKVASVPRKLDEGFERFNREHASRSGHPIQGSAIITHLSDRPVVDFTITPESVEFSMSEGISSYFGAAQDWWQDLLDSTEGAQELFDIFNEGRSNAKEGLEFIFQNGIIPSAVMAMGDQVIEMMNTGDQEDSITTSFRKAVTSLSNVSTLFSGIQYPWLSPMSYASTSVQDASSELYGSDLVGERVAGLNDAANKGATLDIVGSGRHWRFEENMRRFMNHSLKNQNFKTYADAKTFMYDVISNPDKHSITEQIAYLTIWNEGFDGLKGFLDSGTKDNATQTHEGLVKDHFIAMMSGQQIFAGKAGTSPFDFIWDLGNNAQNLKIYQTPSGQVMWDQMRNWMQGLYEDEYRSLTNLPDSAEIPPWRVLPSEPHTAGQGYQYLFDDLEKDTVQQTATIMTLAKLDAMGGFVDDKGNPVRNAILDRIGSQVKAGLNAIDITNIEEKVRNDRGDELLPAFTALTTMYKLLDRRGTTEGYEQRLSLLSNSLGFTRQSLNVMEVATDYLQNTQPTFNPWAIALRGDVDKIEHMADMLRDAESGTRNVFVGLSSILHGEVDLPEISPRNVLAMNDMMAPDYAFIGLDGPEQAEEYHSRMDSEPDGARDILFEGDLIPGTRAAQALSMFNKYGIAIAAPTYQGAGWFWGVTSAKKEVKQKALDEYKMLYDAGLINGDYHEALRTSHGHLPHNIEEWTVEDIGDILESDYEYMLNNTLDGVRRLYNSPEGRNAINVMKTLMGGRADLKTILHGRRLLTPDHLGGERVIHVGNNVDHKVPYADGLRDAFERNKHLSSFNNMDTPWSLIPNKVDAKERARRHGELTTVMEVLDYATPEDRKTEVEGTMRLLQGSDIMRDLKQSGVTPTAMKNIMAQIMSDVVVLSKEDPETFEAMRKMDRGRLLINAIHRLTKSGEYPKLTEVRGFQFKTPAGAMMFTPSDRLKKYGLIDVVYVAEPQYVEVTSNRPATDARVLFKVVTRSTGGEGRDIGLTIGHLPLAWTQRVREPKPVNPKEDWTALQHAASPNLKGMFK